MRKIVSQEEEQEWIKRYIAGETARSISKDYPQYSEDTVSKHIRKAGYSRGRGHSKRVDDLKEIVIKEYINDKYSTCSSLSKKYNICDRTISGWLHEKGVEMHSGVPSHCDEDYFEKIDTPDKAYLLGFITADGAVVGKNKDKPRACSIEVKETDIDLIYFAQKQINPDAAITPCFYKEKRNYRISFNSTKICQDLGKYGIIQNKSKVIEKVPIDLIPDDFLRYYFRGLIDGDGCVHKNGGISIYSGSENFIRSVQQVLIEKVGLTQLSIYKGTTYFISWHSKKDRQKLFDYLYGNLNTTFYYNRKYIRLYNSLYDNTEVRDEIT